MSDIQSLLNELKSNVIGQTITQLYCTKPSHHQELFDGQAIASYFRTVMELDGTQKFDFGIDWFKPWSNEEKLFTIEELDWQIADGIEYKNKKIIDVLLDEVEHIFFLLENDVVVMASIDLGNDIYVSHRNEFFDENWNYM